MDLTLENCLKYVEDGKLTMHESANGKLVGFKYSLGTVYGHYWDEITMQCRGIVFEKSTGKIVAHPFDKFFNWQEIYAEDGTYAEIGKILCNIKNFEPAVTKQFIALDKLDGSLAIVFCYENDWWVKTAGAFDSDQAVWAKKWLDANIDTSYLTEGYTYCFEIISNQDPHVCKYDYNGLVLLGFYNQNHRPAEFMDIVELAYKLECRYATQMKFNSIEEALTYTKGLDVNHEGFVLTFKSGFKVKIKGLEYLEKFHMISGITKKDIRLHYDETRGCIDPEYFASIPEELTDMKLYAKKIDDLSRYIYDTCLPKVPLIEHLEGREKYETAKTLVKSDYLCILMDMAKGKTNIWPKIWTIVRREIKEPDDED